MSLTNCVPERVPLAHAQQGVDDDSHYEIRDDVLIKSVGGATLSAIVVRKKAAPERLPTLLSLDIYTNPARTIDQCKATAAGGYVCMSADVRGKRLSRDPPVPYEHEAEDSHAVLDSSAEHYAVMGPYDHFGAQADKKESVLRG